MTEFPQVVLISAASLRIDPRYQRTLNDGRVRRIAESFDHRLFDPITVALRPDGEFYIVDGGHHCSAAMAKDIDQVPARIIETSGFEEEADLFSYKNMASKPLSALERHHAAVGARHKEALTLQAAIDETGWSLGADIRCIGAMTSAQRWYGGEAVRRALAAMRTVVPQGSNAEAWIVAGVISFIGTWPECKDTSLVSVLTKNWIEVKKYVQAMGDLGTGNRGPICAQGIFAVYDKRYPNALDPRTPKRKFYHNDKKKKGIA